MPKSTSGTVPTLGSDTDTTDDHHSPVTENYLLSLYKLWEDSDFPTVTQLTDNLKQLPLTEGLGTSVPSVAGMVRRMEKQGLVDVGSDKKIRPVSYTHLTLPTIYSV